MQSDTQVVENCGGDLAMLSRRGTWDAICSLADGIMFVAMVCVVMIGAIVAVLDFDPGAGAVRAAASKVRSSGSRPTDAFVRFSAAASVDGPTVYVVGSDDDARVLLAGLRDLDSVRCALGLPPFPTDVVSVASADEANRIKRDIDEVNVIRSALGLALYTVVQDSLIERAS